MAQSTRETEFKYAAPAAGDTGWLPDLTAVPRVAALADRGVRELDAVYHDTDDLRLARTAATLRRRTGGPDEGWHLKLPLPDGSREEIRAPLSDELPDELRDLALSRTRGAPLRPVVRIRTTRSVRHLLDAGGAVLAELSLDTVRADPLRAEGRPAVWTEMEVELAEDGDPALLAAVDTLLRENGVERARSASKLARALAETTPGSGDVRVPRADVPEGSAAAHVLAYADAQVHALVGLDPAVRRGRPDTVHDMRVACRRLLGCLRAYRTVLDPGATGRLRADLKWLAGELGAERDQEVLGERLAAGVRDLPGELVLGPVAARLTAWNAAQHAGSHRRTLDALASPRYLALLAELNRLATDPPLRGKATRAPEKVMAKALRKEFGRLEGRMRRALELPPGPDRDDAIHRARKAAKRLRYAAEAARPALGRPAKRLGRRAKAVQRVAGDHHDGVVARGTLRRLAVAAHAAGEPGFTWGLLYGQERAAAAGREQRLSAEWERAADPALRASLGR
ncbi:CYTH and CHAD domain-containing protein [Streptomyces sp. NPDC046831]|uniref:CYTH and CHAD domain-containing protein n=1 Tax=Streptomyces sp. NPDC046831 TaxID=3154805 RepID=UPI0033E5F64B